MKAKPAVRSSQACYHVRGCSQACYQALVLHVIRN